MSQERPVRRPVSRIEIRLQVGEGLLAASDDPLFLGIAGPCGREFRLELAHGRSLRRGAEDHYVLGPKSEPATNVKHSELNDPTEPSIDADAIAGVYLRKGTDPIPNVRAVGELDDRLQVIAATVEIHVENGASPIRYGRRGPIWLGLASGLRFELARLSGTP